MLSFSQNLVGSCQTGTKREKQMKKPKTDVKAEHPRELQVKPMMSMTFRSCEGDLAAVQATNGLYRDLVLKELEGPSKKQND